MKADNTFLRLLAGLIFALSASVAQAVVIDDVIYDNGVLPSEGADAYSSATFTDKANRQLADDFMLDSGSTWSVTDVHWLGFDIQDDPTSTFNIYFYEDSGGVPTGGPGDPSATAIETLSVSVTGSDTGEIFNAKKVFEYWAFIDPVELVGGRTYWLSIQSSDDVNWLWLLDDDGGNAKYGAPDSGLDYWTDSTVVGATCFSSDGCSAAFQLTGRVAIVPIPPVIWLFGSGLLGLIGISRRKKAA